MTVQIVKVIVLIESIFNLFILLGQSRVKITFKPIFLYKNYSYLNASEPKLVNSILNIIGVNSLMLGGLHLIFIIINKGLKSKVI